MHIDCLQFQDIHVSHIPRSKNDKAVALANLATSLTLPDERDIQITVGEHHLLPPTIERIEEVVDSNVITASEYEEELDDLDWHHPIIKYLQHGKLPNDSRKKAEVQRRATRCLSKQDATKAHHDTHAGTCGAHQKIISDNALYFKCKSMTKLCEKYMFQHSFSASYNSSSNGQSEAFNKILCNILKKMISGNKRDWHERLPEALWAYRTTIRNSTRCTPYNLVFGFEAILPLKVQLPSLRVALQLANPDKNANVRLAELKALDEKKLVAQQRLEIYQAQVAWAFNRKVKFISFSIADLVLTVQRPFVITRKMHGKFEPK
ncbi:unnamed protein product [Prunus armeniaca]